MVDHSFDERTVLPGDQSERILQGETALKVFREHLGFELHEIASRAGLQPERLAEMEAGTALPDVETLKRVADALDVPVTWIEPEDYLTNPVSSGRP